MLRFLYVLLVLVLAPVVATAAGTNPNRASPLESKVFLNSNSTNQQNVLENVPLTTSPTYFVKLDRQYSGLIISVFYTRGVGGAASAIQIAQDVYQDGVHPARLQSRNIVSGESTLDDFSDNRAVTTTKAYTALVGVSGYYGVMLLFTATGPAATDVISVQITAVVGE